MSGERFLDGNYFSLIAAAGADIQWILTGVHSANVKVIVDRQTAFKESVESVVKLQLPKTNEQQADIDSVLYEDKIKIVRAAEENPGYSGLCQEQKQLLDNLKLCTSEYQVAIRRMVQLGVKDKKD